MLDRLLNLSISHKLKLTFYREQCLLLALAFGLSLCFAYTLHSKQKHNNRTDGLNAKQ